MVLVVGAGPAGCSAAHELAQAGHEVTLIERAPGHVKPCGGGIPFRAVERFGVPDELIDRRVTAMVVHGPGGRSIRCEASSGYYTAMLRRELLDKWLLDRALGAGAQFVVGSFTGFTIERGVVRATVRTEEGERTLEGHALLGADGVGSRVRQAIGSRCPRLIYTRQDRIAIEPFGEYAEAAHFWFDGAVAPSGYGWAFPKSDHIAVGLGNAARHAKGLEEGLLRIKRAVSPQAPDVPVLRREGYRLPIERVGRRVADRVLLLGDAAGYVAPFTGEGILYALWSGLLAVRTLLDNWDKPTAERLAVYQDTWDRQHRFSWGTMHLLERVFLRNDVCRSAFVHYLAAPEVGRALTDAWTARSLRSSGGLHPVRTPARILACLLWSYLVHLGGLRHPAEAASC